MDEPSDTPSARSILFFVACCWVVCGQRAYRKRLVSFDEQKARTYHCDGGDVLRSITYDRQDDQTDESLANRSVVDHLRDPVNKQLRAKCNETGRDEQQHDGRRARHRRHPVLLLVLAYRVGLVDHECAGTTCLLADCVAQIGRRSHLRLLARQAVRQGVCATQAVADGGASDGQGRRRAARGVRLRWNREDRVREQVRQWRSQIVQATHKRTSCFDGRLDCLHLWVEIDARYTAAYRWKQLGT